MKRQIRETYADDEFLSVGDVARILGISNQVVSRWLLQKKITYMRMGNGPKANRKVQGKDLREFIESMKIQAEEIETIDKYRARAALRMEGKLRNDEYLSRKTKNHK